MSRRIGPSVRVLLSVALATMSASACVGDPPGPPTPDGGLDGSTDATGAGGSARGGAGGGAGMGAGGTGTGGTMGGAGGAAGSLGGPGSVAGTLVRTLAYHQVTALTASPTSPALLSPDGKRIVYAIAPGTGDPATPNRIFVVNPDGTGNVMVDSYVPNCFCGAVMAMSTDGSTIVSTDTKQVRVVGADGTRKGTLNFDSNEILNLAMSGDGSTVFMLHRRDNNITGGARIERGLWAMNADGSNLRQILGPPAIAAMMGVTPDLVFPFSGCGKSLEVSADGKHAVVALTVGGMGELSFAVDGSTARKVKGPHQAIKQVAISSDGSKLAAATVQGNVEETVVMGFDGGGSKVITTKGQGSCFSPVTLNADGSQLLLGDLSLLFPTAGGDPVNLHVATAGDGIAIGSPCCDVVPSMSMSGDAKRFAYRNLRGPGLPVDIGLLEIDPATLGAAPTITSPTFSVGSIPRDRSVGAEVSCRVAAPGALVRVGTALFVKGQEDLAGSWLSGKLALRDDGMLGDATANDGIFTTGNAKIASGEGGEVGPRLTRIKAETKAADGRRHATAIDFTGLEVK